MNGKTPGELLGEAEERALADARIVDDYRDEVTRITAELNETRAAFAELAGHFGKGAQSGWTARVSGTVLHRLCLAAKVPDPGAAPVIMGAGAEHIMADGA